MSVMVGACGPSRLHSKGTETWSVERGRPDVLTSQLVGHGVTPGARSLQHSEYLTTESFLANLHTFVRWKFH